MLQMLSQASLFALFSLVVSVLPLGFGAAYAIWPTEQRLALLRPVSVAGIFGGLAQSVRCGRPHRPSKRGSWRSARPKPSCHCWSRPGR
jgi:hypothetical protein